MLNNYNSYSRSLILQNGNGSICSTSLATYANDGDGFRFDNMKTEYRSPFTYTNCREVLFERLQEVG